MLLQGEGKGNLSRGTMQSLTPLSHVLGLSFGDWSVPNIHRTAKDKRGSGSEPATPLDALVGPE